MEDDLEDALARLANLPRDSHGGKKLRCATGSSAAVKHWKRVQDERQKGNKILPWKRWGCSSRRWPVVCMCASRRVRECACVLADMFEN